MLDSKILFLQLHNFKYLDIRNSKTHNNLIFAGSKNTVLCSLMPGNKDVKSTQPLIAEIVLYFYVYIC